MAPWLHVGRFDLTCFYSSTSKASPNDAEIVIVIIIGEAELIFHSGGIIAQDYLSKEILLDWERIGLQNTQG